MSSNEEEKAEGKSYPLDLAAKIGASKPPAESKPTTTPLLLPGGGPLRSFRIMPQPPTASATTGGATIITNIVPQATIIKQGDATRHITGIINTAQVQPQVSGNITLQRQITFPVVAQTASHLPRGASVVANLSAPRSNVAAAIRGPLVVTAAGQATNMVRNARAPSPAQGGTAWISSTSSNGSQVKGVPAVLSAGRATTITTGKPTSVVTKPPVGQIVSTIKQNTTILQSAIIGQNQLHPFKTAVPGIQTLNTTVALAQVMPARTQTLVYSTGTPGFAPAPRITVASAVRGQTTVTTRPMAQVTAARLAVPGARILTPPGAMITPTARITAIPATQSSTGPTRIISTQSNISLGRITVAVTNAPTNTVNPILTQMRSNLVVPATNAQNRGAGAQGAKVIAQPASIHLTAMPPAGLKTTAISTPRTITSQTTITQRPTAVVSSHAMGIAKVYPNQEGQPASLYLQTPVQHSSTRRTSPGPPSQIQTASTTSASKYPFYDDSSRFPRTFGQTSGTTITAISSVPQTQSAMRPAPNAPTMNTANRYNPIMAGGEGRTFTTQDNSADMQNVQAKVTSSPRPSILRKREHDSNTPLKAAKNLMSSLANLQQPLSPPSRPDSRNNGHSSGGSTTISATSSPGLADANDDSNQHMPMNKEEEENRPPLEMSPRKKPRKQNLAGNDMDENDDDMQFISERDIKREHDESDGMNSDYPHDGAPETRRGVTNARKPASASLLNYMQRWKTTNNHYQRHSDVRPKDERRPTIIEMSNQHRVLEKVNGWKIHHLSTQMEDLAEEEHTVHNQLGDILKFTDKQDLSNPEINRITELIKGNMQRVKIIKDGMIEANSSIMKIFDHKVHVTDIINRCASKRNYKKREKS